MVYDSEITDNGAKMLMVILLIEMEETQFGAVIRDVWGEEFSSRESAGS